MMQNDPNSERSQLEGFDQIRPADPTSPIQRPIQGNEAPPIAPVSYTPPSEHQAQVPDASLTPSHTASVTQPEIGNQQEAVSEAPQETANPTAAETPLHAAEPVRYSPPVSYTPTAGGSGAGYAPTGSYNPDGTYHFTGTPYPQQPTATPVAKKEANPKPPRKKRERKQSSFSFAAVLAFVLVAAILGAGCGVGGYILVDRNSANSSIIATGSSTSNTAQQTINITGNTDSMVTAVATKCLPSVVGIRTTVVGSNNYYNYFYGSGSTDSDSQSTGEGSGIIYSTDGYIITNYHVIEQAVEYAEQYTTSVDVYLTEDPDTAIQAEVIGYNISYDLAVLKIDRTNLPAIELGNSDQVSVGDYAVAIGCPGGLEFMGSVSYGIVSGINRTLSSNSGTSNSNNAAVTPEYIQTDAAINPGNSGGALCNSSGQLIGINSIKLVSESYEGMGFAIPVNNMVEICDQIIAKKGQPQPYIGITVSSRYTANLLQMYGYPTGAVVSSVDSGSTAEDAGIERGDIITEFNGTTVSDYSDMGPLINSCTVGDEVSVTIYRSGRYYTTKLTIGSNGATS